MFISYTFKHTNPETNVHFRFPPITSPDDALQFIPPTHNYIPQQPDNPLPWEHFDDIPKNDYIPTQPILHHIPQQPVSSRSNK